MSRMLWILTSSALVPYKVVSVLKTGRVCYFVPAPCSARVVRQLKRYLLVLNLPLRAQQTSNKEKHF